MAHGGGINLFAAIGVADGRQQIAKGKNAPDHLFIHPECIGNLGRFAALLDQLRKLFPLRYLIGIFADKISNERGLQGGGIVAIFEYRARERSIAATFFGHRGRGMITPPPCDNLECVGAAVGTDQQGNKNAPHPHRGQYIANVRRLLGVSHIGG